MSGLAESFESVFVSLCIFKLPLLGGLFTTLCGVICGSGLAQVKTDVPAPSVAAESVTDAQIELKAFQKIDLRPNERATVSFTLGKRDLSTWDESQHRWVTPSGTYQIMIGSSSRDIRAQQSVSLD